MGGWREVILEQQVGRGSAWPLIHTLMGCIGARLSALDRRPRCLIENSRWVNREACLWRVNMSGGPTPPPTPARNPPLPTPRQLMMCPAQSRENRKIHWRERRRVRLDGKFPLEKRGGLVRRRRWCNYWHVRAATWEHRVGAGQKHKNGELLRGGIV